MQILNKWIGNLEIKQTIKPQTNEAHHMQNP